MQVPRSLSLFTFFVISLYHGMIAAFSFPVSYSIDSRRIPTLRRCLNMDRPNDEYRDHIAARKQITRRRIMDESLFFATMVSSLIPSTSNAMYTDPVTRIILPSQGEIESAIPSSFGDDNPLEGLDKSSFSRLDATPDGEFYKYPRFTEHVDENAVQIMKKYIGQRVLKPKDSVLDLCSSWTSHIDRDTVEYFKLQRVAGLGMNQEELQANSILTDYKIVDLNANPDVKLPYDDASFDVVLCQLSIDYLTYPLNVMKEVSRVLKPGGRVVILFSNRLFIEKAIGLWTGKDDLDHVYTVGAYLNFCNGGFVKIHAEDLSTRKKRGKENVIVGDPMYAVIGEKGYA